MIENLLVFDAITIRERHGNGTFHTSVAITLKRHRQFELRLEGSYIFVYCHHFYIRMILSWARQL